MISRRLLPRIALKYAQDLGSRYRLSKNVVDRLFSLFSGFLTLKVVFGLDVSVRRHRSVLAEPLLDLYLALGLLLEALQLVTLKPVDCLSGELFG